MGCQRRNNTPAFLPVLTTAAAGPRERPGSSFLLTSTENCPTIEDGRRSGGDCWRAPPRNTRLDSSRTMGGRSQLRPDFKHIGPIDPDAFTLNQFLKLLVIRAIADVLVDGREVQVKILRTALNATAGPQAPAPDSRTGDQERDAGSPIRIIPPLLMPKLNAREDSCLF